MPCVLICRTGAPLAASRRASLSVSRSPTSAAALAPPGAQVAQGALEKRGFARSGARDEIQHQHAGRFETAAQARAPARRSSSEFPAAAPQSAWSYLSPRLLRSRCDSISSSRPCRRSDSPARRSAGTENSAGSRSPHPARTRRSASERQNLDHQLRALQRTCLRSRFRSRTAANPRPPRPAHPRAAVLLSPARRDRPSATP